MSKEEKIKKEDMKEYIISQIKIIKECSKNFELKFFPSYLELAEQVLDEELNSSCKDK